MLQNKPYFFNTNNIIYEKSNGIILFINKESDQVIKISELEYELVLRLCQLDTEDQIIKEHQDSGVTKEFLAMLVETAVTLRLLINEENIFEHGRNRLATFLYNTCEKLLSKQKSLRPEFKKTFLLYKVFSFDGSQTWLGKAFSKKIMARVFLSVLLSLSSILMIWLMYSYNLNWFLSIFRASIVKVHFSPYKFLLLCQLLVTTTWIWHEIGHYIIYKSYAGKKDEFGIGLLYFFLPVLFVSTNSVSLWDNKLKKVLVSLGGTVFDLVFIIGALVFITVNHATMPAATVILSISIFSILFRFIFNLNCFLPGSDGYFILSDTLGINNLYKKSAQYGLILINEYRSLDKRRIGQLKRVHYSFSLYYLICLLMVFSTYVFMLVSIGYYLYDLLSATIL